MRDNWSIKFVTDWDEIYSPDFQGKWLFWAENAVNGHVFFHPALCMAWLETYRTLRQLQPLICIVENRQNLFFLPLVLWRKNWKNAFQRIIVPVGYSDFDYHDPYWLGYSDDGEKAEVFRYVIDEIKRRFNFDTLEINGILATTTGNGWSKEDEVSPFCSLETYKDSEEFLLRLKGSLRGDIRRQIRRIEELGSLRLVEITDLDEALKVLPSFLALHVNRWPKAYKAPGFHENLIRNGLVKNIVHFTALTVNDSTISYHLGFRFASIYYYYMPAIDPQYENLSPGKIHLFKLVDYAIKNEFHIFDHLRGEENYKSGWTDSIRSLYRFSLQSNRLASKCRNNLVTLKKVFV